MLSELAFCCIPGTLLDRLRVCSPPGFKDLLVSDIPLERERPVIDLPLRFGRGKLGFFFCLKSAFGFLFIFLSRWVFVSNPIFPSSVFVSPKTCHFLSPF